MHTFFLRIRTDRISLFRFLLEGYDGLAVLSTVDVRQGLVRLTVPKSRQAELQQLLEAICHDLAPLDGSRTDVQQKTWNVELLQHEDISELSESC